MPLKVSKPEVSYTAIYTNNFWCEGIALYVDGVRFEYKSNPYEHAKSLGSREGKINCHVMVGMTCDEGVVLCVPLSKRISGENFVQIIKKDVKDALDRSKKKSKRIAGFLG